ncbi:MAG: hypothetical protein KGM24_12710 [Elusimicrobia bacterium]|nr:hypothetical protein [Elusimicrobiota bacterium]
MSGEPAPRSGRAGGLIVAVVVAGSFAGVGGWYLLSNRPGPPISTAGFDLSSTPKAVGPAPVLPADDRTPAPQSGLSMLKGGEGISVAGEGGAPPPSSAGGASGAAAASPKDQSRDDFKANARKDEAVVRAYAEKMTREHPSLLAYGRDWMSHPDLRKLNDDYMRDHDPVAFLTGLARAPSFGPMMHKWAGDPAIRQFIVQGVSQAPAELTSSAMGLLSNDGAIKSVVSSVAAGVGLPPSLVAMIDGGDPSKVDQTKVVGDIMNRAAARGAMQQSGQPESVPLDQ